MKHVTVTKEADGKKAITVFSKFHAGVEEIELCMHRYLFSGYVLGFFICHKNVT